MKISFSSSAITDLQNIKDYYLDEGIPEIGKKFVHSIFEHVETLVDHPDIGRIVPEFDEPHIRELIHPPFRIVYLREMGVIQVIRVWRSERLLDLSESDT